MTLWVSLSKTCAVMYGTLHKSCSKKPDSLKTTIIKIDECMILWGKPECGHMQSMEHLYACQAS